MNQRIGSLACALAIAAALLAHEASAQPLSAFYFSGVGLEPYRSTVPPPLEFTTSIGGDR